ncbi:MAG TPA: hypothetical protein VLR71_20590 [Casimicrobiaceae bacterium]|nr:hypothetical protein [Casimicrobiaceae bacterium]
MGFALARLVPAVGGAILVAANAHAYQYTISPPIVKGDVPPVAATPLRKEEARIKDETAKVAADSIHIYVEGRSDPDRRMPPPRSVEQKFAEALNEGNPEVAGGWIRHGTFYDGVFYWGHDPLSFVYYNVVNRLKD